MAGLCRPLASARCWWQVAVLQGRFAGGRVNQFGGPARVLLEKLKTLSIH
jgi:hypothetical protein